MKFNLSRFYFPSSEIQTEGTGVHPSFERAGNFFTDQLHRVSQLQDCGTLMQCFLSCAWLYQIQGGKSCTFHTPGDADTKNPAIPHSYLRSDLILHRKPCGDEEKMNRWIVWEQLTLEQPPEGKHIFLCVVCLLSLSVLVCSADKILTVSQQKKPGAFVSRARYSKVTSLNVWQLILIQSCAVSLEERSISHKNCTNSQAMDGSSGL